MAAGRYYRKPVPVDAWQVTADNADAAAAWVEANGGSVVRYDPRVMRESGITATHAFQVKIFAGYAWARFGDFIVHGQHAFSVIAPDLFACAYDAEGVPDAAPDR